MNFRVMMVCPIWLAASFSVQAQKPEAEMLRDAQRLYDTGKLADAEKSFAEIAREHPANVSAQMFLGQTLFREAKFMEAIGPYEKVKALENSGTKLTLMQRRLLDDQLVMAYGLGRLRDAKALLEKSVHDDPEYPLNYYNLACLAADEDDKAAVLRELNLAFQHRSQVLAGEQMPNPEFDSSFKKYAGDAEFKALAAKFRRN